MYKVVKTFVDLQDGAHRYNVGDAFPRNGLEVSNKRLAELSSVNNRQGVPLIVEKVEGSKPAQASIAEAETEEKPKQRGRRKKES